MQFPKATQNKMALTLQLKYPRYNHTMIRIQEIKMIFLNIWHDDKCSEKIKSWQDIRDEDVSIQWLLCYPSQCALKAEL